MFNCKFCGKYAGFLKRKHKACEEKNIKSKETIDTLIKYSFIQKENFNELKPKIQKLAKEGFINQEELNDIYLSNYDLAVQQFLYDCVLTQDEEKKLSNFKECLDIDEDLLDKNGSFQEFIKTLIIKNLAEGKDTKTFFSKQEKDFNLEKQEKIIWIFEDVELYEDLRKQSPKTKLVGFKTTSFEQNLVNTKKIDFLDKGKITITNRNLYYDSYLNKLKINIKDIISLTPYEDGLGFQYTQTGEKQLIFKDLDGRFLYNIIYNLQNNF